MTRRSCLASRTLLCAMRFAGLAYGQAPEKGQDICRDPIDVDYRWGCRSPWQMGPG